MHSLSRSRIMPIARRAFGSAGAIACVACLVGLLLDNERRCDLQVLDWIAEARNGPLTTLAKSASLLGSILVLGPAVALVAGWLVRKGRLLAACSLGAVAVGVVALANLVKVIVDRPRPPTDHLVPVSSASFPSQHAAQALAILLAFALLISPGSRRVAALTAAVALALVVGLSRIYLGVHYPSDVLGGWALGAAWLAAVWQLSARVRPQSAPGAG